MTISFYGDIFDIPQSVCIIYLWTDATSTCRTEYGMLSSSALTNLVSQYRS